MRYSIADNIIFQNQEYTSHPIKRFLNSLYTNARIMNDEGILSLVNTNSKGVLVDLGCDDGLLTVSAAKKMRTKIMWGVDIVLSRMKIAKKAGVRTVKGDLNKKFPLKDRFFDVVIANQIIEHVSDLDNFVEEIYRVLKPGGYAIISTENASSWCNIFASIMGWQMFSLTNFSKKKWGLGNPMAIHKGDTGTHTEWTHKTILNFSGLADLLKEYGFEIEDVRGAGYFPLPNLFGNIDKRHAHFMTFKARKK